MNGQYQNDTERLGEMFRAFHHMNISCIDREIARRGIGRVNNPKIMFTLRHKGKDRPVLQKQLAEWMGVAPPTVAVSVKRLEKAGLVRKTVNKEDLRENYVELTQEGRALTDACAVIVREVAGQVFVDLTDEEKKTLAGYMTRILQRMEEMGARHPQLGTEERE